jgi:3-oxoacyl-[acyl-carrier-protein] synthase III
MPPNSFLLHNTLGLSEDVFAFDFNHACTGYIYGLAMAHSFISSGLAKQVLLVTSDTYSKYINKKDRSTRVLFGDGAACSIIEKSNTPGGIVDIILASSGKNYDKFWIPAGGMRLPKSAETSVKKADKIGNIRSQENITMNGFEVWAFFNSAGPKQIKRLLKNNKLEKTDIDQFIFHQASQMTLDSVIKGLKLDKEKVFINIRDIGNTVSASIPIALKDAIEQGKIKKGDRVILSGFGVGLSYGSILMEF